MGPCLICGKPGAFGFRLSGLYSQQPKRLRRCGMSTKRLKLPSVDEIRAEVSYNPKSGVFTRLSTGLQVNRRNTAGRLIVRIGGKGYIGSRLAWKLCTGKDPTADIDHINQNFRDDRICNLREATHSQNCANRHSGGSSRYRGVHFARGVWRAVIKRNGVKKYVGSAPCETVAAMMYDAAAVRAHGEFCFSNFPGFHWVEAPK